MYRVLIAGLTLLLFAGCGGGSDSQDEQAAVPPASTGQVPAAMSASEPAGDASGGLTGEVIETMDSGGYTYVKVKTASGEIWAAGPETKVAVGDRVHLPQGMVMRDFASKTLDRTFDEILFVNAIQPAPASAGQVDIPAEHRDKVTNVHAGIQPVDGHVEAGSIAKAPGGHTVAELYAMKDQLAGQEVKVRGKVVKVVRNVMGKNWLHLQDGTGAGDTSDLTVTTSTPVEVGDVVTVDGTAAVDKDFGAGYRYGLIVEDATVTK